MNLNIDDILGQFALQNPMVNPMVNPVEFLTNDDFSNKIANLNNSALDGSDDIPFEVPLEVPLDDDLGDELYALLPPLFPAPLRRHLNEDEFNYVRSLYENEQIFIHLVRSFSRHESNVKENHYLIRYSNGMESRPVIYITE
jgi:hypothetical protein